MIKKILNLFKRKSKEKLTKEQSFISDEFYSIVKLVSGEEILSLMMVDENEGDPIIILQDPVSMKTFYNHQGLHIKIKPWMEMSSDSFFIIKPDKIITMTETKNEKLIKIYTNYIAEKDTTESYTTTTGGSVKPSSRMGYISSVEDARKKLEDLYKGLKES